MSKIRPHVLYNLLQLVIILFVISKTSDACSCMLVHPQQSFCSAEYVITAKVDRSIINNYGGREYDLSIKKIFKSKTPQQFNGKSTIKVTSSDSSCGVDLQMNKLYVIAARSHRLSHCDFVKEYSSITQVQKNGFAGAYKDGCDCHFNLLFDNTTPNQQQYGSCSFAPGSCEVEAGVCIPSNDSTSKCHWRPTDRFRECKNLEMALENIAAVNMA